MLQFLEINYCSYDLLSILEIFTWINIVKIRNNFVNYAITIIKWKISSPWNGFLINERIIPTPLYVHVAKLSLKFEFPISDVNSLFQDGLVEIHVPLYVRKE